MSEIEKQMQMRELLDNSPLREKLLELKQWEKTMKVKEKELKSTNKDEVPEGPPVRSKAKQNGVSNGAIEKSDEDNDIAEKARLEKEQGNKLVAVKDYANAIAHYSRAIEYQPKDPAFFMNRALCYLRLEKFPLAIADCDSALALDTTLSKAYFRRMQSNTQVQNYDAAMGDCIQLIKLDPSNASLRKEFDRIRLLKIDKDNGGRKPAGTPVKAEEPYWDPKPKKLWSKFGADEEELRFADKAPHLRSKKPLKRIPIIETFVPPAPVETFPDHIVDKLFNNFTGESTSNGPVASTSRSPPTFFSPLITPPSPINSSALNLSTCSPDRSIDDIFGGMSAMQPSKPVAEGSSAKPMVQGPLNLELSTDKNALPLSSPTGSISEDKTDVMKPIQQPNPNQPVADFAIPKTGVQFVNTWKDLEEGQRFHFLRQVQEKSSDIVGKLGASLDDTLLTELLDCMNSYFCPKDLNIGDILTHLSQNSEMGILSMMMGESDRRTVEDLLAYVQSRQELSADAYGSLEKAFSG